MTSASPAAAIKAQLKANWTSTEIFEENTAGFSGFTPPSDAQGHPLPFIAIEFPGGVSRLNELGGQPNVKHYREDGAFQIHVNVPMGSGDDTARDWADQIAAFFRGVTLATYTVCYAPFPPQPSESPDGNYFRLSFACPYKYEFTQP